MLLCPEAWSARLAKRWALGSLGAAPSPVEAVLSVLGDAKKGMRPGGTWPAVADTRAAMRAISEPVMGERFFLEQCCARHYNCGSHEAVLK